MPGHSAISPVDDSPGNEAARRMKAMAAALHRDQRGQG